MNFTVNTQVLAQELRIAKQVVPSKPTLPILGYILFEAHEHLHISATDLDVALHTSCPAEITDVGAVALPGVHLLELVEQLPDADLHLTKKGSHIYLTCGQFRSRMQTLPADEFPQQPDGGRVLTTLTGVAFVQLIRQTRYAIGDNKHIVEGALLTLNANTAALVTTDAKRLALATMPTTYSGDPTSLVIPAKTLDVLVTMFPEQALEVAQGENHLFFQADHRTLVSRKMEKQFPAYQRIIPRDHDKQATVSRAHLAAALRRVGLAAGKNLATYFGFRDGALDLSSSSAELGDAAESVSCQYQGAAFLKVCVNWKSVLEFLDVAVEPNIAISLKDGVSPIMLTDGSNHMSVVVIQR